MGKCKAGEVLLSLDERMTCCCHVIRISGKTKERVREGIETLRCQYGSLFPKAFRSITSDNGSEVSGLTESFKEGKVYFIHPYCPGERGTNEKQNSLVRRFVSKGKDINTVPEYVVQKYKIGLTNFRDVCLVIAHRKSFSRSRLLDFYLLHNFFV
ncbi:MAG: IS30 family transposase [Dialister invisus]|uniref:IS30 family transposase n=1 Tax=Dialister invisus TaxID=218538 RepID=UPI002F9334AB